MKLDVTNSMKVMGKTRPPGKKPAPPFSPQRERRRRNDSWHDNAQA
jgi:hypothetical protein